MNTHQRRKKIIDEAQEGADRFQEAIGKIDQLDEGVAAVADISWDFCRHARRLHHSTGDYPLDVKHLKKCIKLLEEFVGASVILNLPTVEKTPASKEDLGDPATRIARVVSNCEQRIDAIREVMLPEAEEITDMLAALD